MYISNSPPPAQLSEKQLIAQEVHDMLLFMIEQGVQATHDELSYVVFMMECLLKEFEGDTADNY